MKKGFLYSLCICFSFLLFGCLSKKEARKAPELNQLIEVNRLPHPFNVNGTLPYAVWVDGERLPLNSAEAQKIVDSLNLEFKQPKDTAKIHSGEGWLYPYNESVEK